MNESEERSYIEGSRAAWRAVLQTALGHLATARTRDPLVALGIVTLELDAVRASLRGVCADHGDNEWSDDLHLVDVIDKHLVPYLESDE